MKKLYCSLLCVFSFAVLGANPEYSIQDLGTLESNSSGAMKVNDEGNIFGIVRNDESSLFMWDHSIGLQLFSLPIQESDQMITLANNAGQFIITCKRTIQTGWFSSKKIKESYFWDPQNNSSWKIEPPTGWESEFVVTSLNDLGQFVIVDPDPSIQPKDRRSAYWDGSEYKTVDKKMMSCAIKINRDGKLFGYKVKNLGDEEESIACIYNPINNNIEYINYLTSFDIDVKHPLVFHALFTNTGITAVFQPYMWIPSRTFLKKPSSALPKKIAGFLITSLNSDGQAVGFYSNKKKPAFWNGEELFDLNEICQIDQQSIWKEIEKVYDLNDHGQIVGIGITQGGRRHAILLNPIE